MKSVNRTAAAVAAVAAACFAAAPAAAQSALENLRIHGYLTQGFAQSSDEPILGIGTEGSAEHRSAALQFRYGISDQDALVVQLRHRQMGSSLLTSREIEDDVKLDWAFYQRRLGPVSARVGRVPMPRGIYNEVRVVGNLLPFYRAPFAYYTESFETVDGAVLSSTLNRAGFSLEAQGYLGGFDYRIVSTAANPLTVADPQTRARLLDERASKVAGTYLWLSTPVTGLRVGAGAGRWEFEKYPFNPAVEEATGSSKGLSFEADFDRFQLRAERMWSDVLPRDRKGMEYESYYVQGGVRLIGGLSVNAQYEAADVRLAVLDGATGAQLLVAHQMGLNQQMPGRWGMPAAGASPEDPWVHGYDYARDLVFGVNYRLNPQVVLKLEHHHAKGYNFDKVVDIFGSGMKSRYMIGSVSVAF